MRSISATYEGYLIALIAFYVVTLFCTAWIVRRDLKLWRIGGPGTVFYGFLLGSILRCVYFGGVLWGGHDPSSATPWILSASANSGCTLFAISWTSIAYLSTQVLVELTHQRRFMFMFMVQCFVVIPGCATNILMLALISGSVVSYADGEGPISYSIAAMLFISAITMAVVGTALYSELKMQVRELAAICRLATFAASFGLMARMIIIVFEMTIERGPLLFFLSFVFDLLPLALVVHLLNKVQPVVQPSLDKTMRAPLNGYNIIDTTASQGE